VTGTLTESVLLLWTRDKSLAPNWSRTAIHRLSL